MATEKDVKMMNAYCENNKYNKYLEDEDLEIYKTQSRAFWCERIYYLICYGISGREDWEPEAEELYYCFDRDENNTGYKYY